MGDQDDVDWLYGNDGQQPPPSRPRPHQGGDARAPRHPPPEGDRRRPTERPEIQPAPRPLPHDGTPRTPPRPRRRRPLRWIGALTALLLVGIVGFYIFTPLHALGEAARVENTPQGNRPPDQPGTTFLLVGSDTRDDLTKEEQVATGVGGKGDSGRTDSMMLLHVPPSGESVLISLPRDSYVTIPGNGNNKLNAAAVFGGPALLTATVEQATGLRIDGYAQIGFAGFARVVNALDGINMCLDKEVPAEMNYKAIPAGCQKLTTKQAMWVVRHRHSEPDQDLGRIRRQRQFMSALVKDSLSAETFLNPVRYWEVTHSFPSGIKLGDETDLGDMIQLARGMRSVSTGGASITVPIANAGATTEVGSSVLWDNKRADQLFGQLARGDTSNMDAYRKK